MPTELPIACSLDAAALKERLGEIGALGEEALLGVEGRTLRFRGTARERVEAVVRAERACCPFLNFELADDGDNIVLTIGAPEGAELVADELVAAFSSR